MLRLSVFGGVPAPDATEEAPKFLSQAAIGQVRVVPVLSTNADIRRSLCSCFDKNFI